MAEEVAPASDKNSETILILAPIGQDAKLIAQVLLLSNLKTEIFTQMQALCERLKYESGVVIVTEEALVGNQIAQLIEQIKLQEVWSDIPIIIMTTSSTNTVNTLNILKTFGQVGNINLLERPLRQITLESTVQGALRARRRQYLVRQLLVSQTEATRVREEFISIASHELRTPLTSLKLMTQMNQRMLAAKNPALFTAEKVGRLIEVTDNQVGRLTRLVEDMLDVSKIGSGKFIIRKAPVDFVELIKQSIERISTQLTAVGCKLILEVPQTLVMSLDQDRIEQVVTNLLTNIIRYAPGSKIEVVLETMGKMAKFSISDNGPGIPKNRQNKIFDRFERATSSNSISGLGLGLYICRQIVLSHSGTIEVESSEGIGTTFRIHLPIGED